MHREEALDSALARINGAHYWPGLNICRGSWGPRSPAAGAFNLDLIEFEVNTSRTGGGRRRRRRRCARARKFLPTLSSPLPAAWITRAGRTRRGYICARACHRAVSHLHRIDYSCRRRRRRRRRHPNRQQQRRRLRDAAAAAAAPVREICASRATIKDVYAAAAASRPSGRNERPTPVY